ncbi:hypothetical protein [Pseudoduganella buxea]|uniref:Uncharacterized protein n=1 Tax=Pseudoduganella buxea TaxID=1949069 RepID=A0A6I3T134_9BURK|nr:hypothetical protein [Pseudoduganella buxea]MTV55163.1 hypothetical protein [Pseudoduganella buxea]
MDIKRQTATVGGYGILASLDREASLAGRIGGGGTRSGVARGIAVNLNGGILGAIAVAVALVLLLGWWLFGGTTPVLKAEPKMVWQAPVAEPALPAAGAAPATPAAPAISADSPAAIVNEPDLGRVPVKAPVPAPRVVAHAAQPVRARVKTAVRAATVPVLAAAPVTDSDVALLTAIVAHANGLAAARDIVEARVAESTESLLQRCGKVGGEEGRLCRARICTSRNADAACRGF